MSQMITTLYTALDSGWQPRTLRAKMEHITSIVPSTNVCWTDCARGGRDAGGKEGGFQHDPLHGAKKNNNNGSFGTHNSHKICVMGLDALIFAYEVLWKNKQNKKLNLIFMSLLLCTKNLEMRLYGEPCYSTRGCLLPRKKLS